MKSIAVFGMIGVGFLLLALSGIWTGLFTGSSQWTSEKAERLSVVRNRLHNLSFQFESPSGPPKVHAGQEPGQAKQEYEQLKLEREQLTAEFQSAHDSPQKIASILKWTGISFAGIGIVGYLVVKES
jgi:cell division protein FtsB